MGDLAHPGLHNIALLRMLYSKKLGRGRVFGRVRGRYHGETFADYTASVYIVVIFFFNFFLVMVQACCDLAIATVMSYHHAGTNSSHVGDPTRLGLRLVVTCDM